MDIKTIQDFKAYTKSLQEEDGDVQPLAFGLGIRRRKGAKTLDVTFPYINYESNYGSAAILAKVSGFSGGDNGFATLDKAQLQQAYTAYAPCHDAPKYTTTC